MKTGIIFKRFFSIFTLVMLTMLSVSANVTAADGDLDTSFSVDGLITTSFRSIDGMGYSIAVQPDQKIIAVGESSNYTPTGTDTDFALVRYTSDGFLDSTFGTDGKINTDFGGNDIGFGVAVQPDGKIVVSGYSETNGDFALARYTGNGTPDNTFGTDGKVTTSYSDYEGCFSVALQTDGKIVAAGFSQNGGNQDFAVMRYNSDGSLDTGFDGDGIVTTPVGSGSDSDVGFGLLIQQDGKIIVTGMSYNGTDYDFAAVRYNSDGSLDTSFDGDGIVTTSVGSGDDKGYFAAIQSDGKIVLAGHSNNGSNDDFAAVRYNTDGSLDSGFGTGGKLTTPVGSGDDRSYGACIQADGKIVITGESHNGSDYDIAVVRYNTDGTLDTTFGNGGIVTTDSKNTDNSGYAGAVQSDGNIVVSGYSVSFYHENNELAVARYLSGNLSPVRPNEVKINADDGAENDHFGSSVCISEDYAVVGALSDDDNGKSSGSAYIFKRDGTGWNQQIKLTASDGAAYDYFGDSVSVSGDYAVIGAYADDDNGKSSGSAYIFTRDGTVWNQQAKLNAGDGEAYDYFGESVSVSGDYAIVGAKRDDDFSGSAYIFKRDGTSWNQQAKLTGDASEQAAFGQSVSISEDYAIVGTSTSAYIFKRDGTSWNKQVKLTGNYDDARICRSVSISGDYAFVGYSDYEGLVYIFKRDGTSWNELFKLMASDTYGNDGFGNDIAMSDGHVITGASYVHNGYAYIYDMSPSAAEIYSPAPGLTLHSTSATLKWNNSDADQYWLWIGTSEGDYDVYSGDQGTNTSVTVSDLPANQSVLYVRLLSKIDGEWLHNDYTYTACNMTAGIQSPTPGSVLGSATETFTWNDSGAAGYWLWIGTSAGDYDVYSGNLGTDTSVTVSELPANGETLYVRLWSRVGGVWIYSTDYTYTACDLMAEIQSPAHGSALGSSAATFSWNSTGAVGYWLWIGMSQGSYDVYSGNLGTDTSVTVSELPANGETLYVRLWSQVDGIWVYNTDITYTACGMTAAVQSPTPGSTLGSVTETFTWNESGASGYWLWIGTSEGGYDVYSSGDLGTGTSAVVSGLPDSGETLYVRLWSKVDGVWIYNTDCIYTAVGP